MPPDGPTNRDEPANHVHEAPGAFHLAPPRNTRRSFGRRFRAVRMRRRSPGPDKGFLAHLHRARHFGTPETLGIRGIARRRYRHGHEKAVKRRLVDPQPQGPVLLGPVRQGHVLFSTTWKARPPPPGNTPCRPGAGCLGRHRRSRNASCLRRMFAVGEPEKDAARPTIH